MKPLQNNPANLPELAFTHSGRFHADDVFSAALLRLLRPNIRIHRGPQVPKGFSGLVFDIGDGPFDHHAKDRPKRPDGGAYAAFGLLWRAYGRHLLAEETARRFDAKFIQPLDMDDNFGTGNLLAVTIGAFNPDWDAPENEDAAFFEAVEVAQAILLHRMKTFAATDRARAVVEKALAGMEDGVVVLPCYLPWKPVLVPSGANFVVYPSPRGGVALQCVPKDAAGKGGPKVPLPTTWHGRPAEELARLSGVADATFCHASGFMAGAAGEAGARALAAQASAQYQKRLQQSAAQRAENARAGAMAQPDPRPDPR